MPAVGRPTCLQYPTQISMALFAPEYPACPGDPKKAAIEENTILDATGSTSKKVPVPKRCIPSTFGAKTARNLPSS